MMRGGLSDGDGGHLGRRRHCFGVCPHGISDLVGKFVNTLATWKGISDAAQESVDASAPDEVESPEFGRLGLMQV